MSTISQKDSQPGFPVTIRKLMRLGHGFGVTLPQDWCRSLNPGAVHYLRVTVHPDGYVIVQDLPRAIIDQPVPLDPPDLDTA